MLLSCGIIPDGGISDEITLVCCSSWDSICATGTRSGHVYLWQISNKANPQDEEITPLCVLIPNSISPSKLLGMVFIISPSPLLQGCTEELLLTLHSDNILRYWSLDNGRCIAQLADSADHEVLQLVSLADKRFVLLVGHQRITIIDTWSRLNCGLLKIASCPSSKRMVNNRIDEDTPEMYKIQSPSGNCAFTSLDSSDHKTDQTKQLSNIYGEYGESMIFNVSTNHDYFDLLKWSSNISLFDYCEENKYPTAHFYTVAAILNTGQVLVWDLSNLIRIWWHFIPIPHCEIPCPVPKPKLSSVPKPFIKYCQDHSIEPSSSESKKYQYNRTNSGNSTETRNKNTKTTGSSEELIGTSEDSKFVFEYSNNDENPRFISYEGPNIYQAQSNKSPMLAPTLFSLHPCFVSEPINLYSIPSNEMFSTQIIVTDLYLIVNGKYRLIIWKRTFLPHLQNRSHRYQPFGDLFVPNTPQFSSDGEFEGSFIPDTSSYINSTSANNPHEATRIKRSTSCSIKNSDTNNKHRLCIWLGFSQISLNIHPSVLLKTKTFSPIITETTDDDNRFKNKSFLAWSSDMTIYDIKIPSIVSFLFSQDYNPSFESKFALKIRENSEIDSFGDYNDIIAVPILTSRDHLNVSRHMLNYLGHLSTCWQFFRINTLSDQSGRKAGSPISFDDHLFDFCSDRIIWIHRNNFKLIQEKMNEPFVDSFIDKNVDRILYTFLNFNKVDERACIPIMYDFPLLPNTDSAETIKSFKNHSYMQNNIVIYDSMNAFCPVETGMELNSASDATEINKYTNSSCTKGLIWKSTCSLKLVWENYITNFNTNSGISVIACHITEQKGSIYCIISLSNGKILGQCLTGEFGLFNFMSCNEDKHFFGNIDNGVVYQLPTPKVSRDHVVLVTELRSVTDGCIFGLTCCGCVLVWKVDLIENIINDFVNCNSGVTMGYHSNPNTKTSLKTIQPSKKTQIATNNLFSLILCLEGLFFTNVLSLSSIIVFDINKFGELETPKYDKFQVLIHSSLEKKCIMLSIKDDDNGKGVVSGSVKKPLGCIWDERKNYVQTECQGVSYEATGLSLCTHTRHDFFDSRITSVGIDNPSNYIYILHYESIFIFDRDSCILLTVISLGNILNMNETEYQSYHLSFGLISNLNRFVQTSNKVEFLDHGIMYGSLFIGYVARTNNSSTCLNVCSSMNLSYIIFNPHVSTDVVSIEKKKQKYTKTYKYLQHLFPLLIRSTDEFLCRLFVDMAPLSVRPIMRFRSVIIGVNYSISIPISNINSKQVSSKSVLWDCVDSHLNISKIRDPKKTKRSESVDRFRSIYRTPKESKIRSYTFDGVGLPPYRYVVSENWSHGLLRHLDIKAMPIKTLRSKLMARNNTNINAYNGKQFGDWKKQKTKRKQFGVETNDYYIGELSGIPCTSHLVNQIVRSRHSVTNKTGTRSTKSPESQNNYSMVHRTLNRGKTFDEGTSLSRSISYLEKNVSKMDDKFNLEGRFETPRPLFRSRTYEYTINAANKEGTFGEEFEFKIDDTYNVWLSRFLSERSTSSNNYSVDTSCPCYVFDLNTHAMKDSGLYPSAKFPEYSGFNDLNECFSPHHLAIQMVFLHYYLTYYSNLDLPIQLLDKFLLSWIISHVGQERIVTRFIPSYLLSITGMTLDVFNPYIRSSAKYCLQLAIRSFPSELLTYCEEITINTLSGILMEFSSILSKDSQQSDQTTLLEKDVLNSNKLGEDSCSENSHRGDTHGEAKINVVPPWNESCKRGKPKNYSYCCISLCRMIGYRLPFPVMNSGEYYRSNLSIEDLSLFFLSMVLYEHPFKRKHSKRIGKVTLSFLISIIVSYDIEIISKFSKNFDRKHLEKKRLIKPIYARRNQNEQWYSWENLHIDVYRSNIITNSPDTNKSKESLNYDFNSYYNIISIMDTVRFLFAIDLFSLNFTSLLKSKYIEDTLIPDLLKNSLTNWEGNIFNAAKLFQIENNMLSEEVFTVRNNVNVSSKVSNSIICLCIRLLTLAQYPPFWTSCKHLLQLIGQLNPSTYIFILGYSGRTAYPFMGINYTCNILSLLIYFISNHPEYSFPHLDMVIEITIGFLDPLDSTLRKGTITAVTSVLFILVSVFPMITFHQNTQRLAIGYESSIIVYDLRTATKWRVLQGHKGRIDALCFNKEGEYLASYSISEKSLRIWQCTQSGLLGGLLGISGSCIKIIELSEIPQRPLNTSLHNRLKSVRISCKNEDEWQLRRENNKTYSITIERG